MIYIPDNVGSSKSITSSLGLVYDVYEKVQLNNDDRTICLFGNFVLNEQVKKEFKELGIITVYNINDITSNNIVILNSFGVNKKVYEYLNNNNIEYYDGTNKKIIKLQNEINYKYDNNYEIIFVGDYSDIELINLNSYCNNNGIFISREEEFVKLSNNNNKYIICSSSFNKEKFKNICDVIENNYNCKLEIYELKNDFDVIIKESIKTSKKCDLIFVVGDQTSDTNTLLSNLDNSIYFNDIKEFLKYCFENNLPENIGITAGINTPLKEIYNYKYLLSFIIFYKKRLLELKNNQEKINSELINKNDNDIVKEIIYDFIDLNKDGKYIRAMLIALGELLSSNSVNNYLNLAYAYEMFQTSVLIHDDIIDNAKTRRGKETIPRRICRKYLNRKNDKSYQFDTLKYANSISICAGDLGFYESNKIIIKNYKDSKNLSKILEVYNDIITDTIKGEMLDVSLPFLNKYNYYITKEKDIIDIYHLKTSLYSIIGPFMLGYALNGLSIDNKQFDVLNKIGILFQIKDDLLGIFSNEEITGKSNKSDIEEFKQTILYSYIINTSYKNNFLDIYGKNNITDKDLEDIRELLYKSGALDYANIYMDNLIAELNDSIDALDISDEGKDIFKGLILYINLREK